MPVVRFMVLPAESTQPAPANGTMPSCDAQKVTSQVDQLGVKIAGERESSAAAQQDNHGKHLPTNSADSQRVDNRTAGPLKLGSWLMLLYCYLVWCVGISVVSGLAQRRCRMRLNLCRPMIHLRATAWPTQSILKKMQSWDRVTLRMRP